MHSLVRLLKAHYQERRRKAVIRRFCSLAEVGENCHITREAHIENESADRSRILIGANTTIWGTIVCKTSGVVRIGRYCVLQDSASIGALENVTIGDFVGRRRTQQTLKTRCRASPISTF